MVELMISGMPLLDRLKTVQAPPPPSGLSLAEEWMSLSAAIGLDVDAQPLPGPSRPPSPRSIQKGKSKEEDEMWSKLLEICPEDLVDQ
jgi:hypothetical protein